MTYKELRKVLDKIIKALKNIYYQTKKFESIKFRGIDSNGSIKQLNKDMVKLMGIVNLSAVLAGEQLAFEGLKDSYSLNKSAEVWKNMVEITDLFLYVINAEQGIEIKALSEVCMDYYQQLVNAIESANSGDEVLLGEIVRGETEVFRLEISLRIKLLKSMRNSKAVLNACIKQIG